MKRLVFPGSFDPITVGHLDLIRRGAGLADELIVALLPNPNKQYAFTMQERADMVRACVADIPNVRVMCAGGLLVDYVTSVGADAILRGLRTAEDFEYEKKYFSLNRRLAPGIEEIFLLTDDRYAYLCSGTVREIAPLGADIRGMVPDAVYDRVIKKLRG